MEHGGPFTLHSPRSLVEASVLLARMPGARPIAGGTDLLPNLRNGLGEPAALVDLAGIAAFDTFVMARDGTTIGAGVTLARLATDERLRRTLPTLAEAARAVAAPAHRTVATLGGNLCQDTRCVFYNQSAWWRQSNGYCLKLGGDTCHVAPQGRHCHAAFSSDLAPVLMVQGAEVEIAGLNGARRIPLATLYVEDGAKHLALAAGEIVAAVRIPPQPVAARAGYRKARARGAIDFPLAGVAVRVEMHAGTIGDLRVALTGTNSRPLLLEGVDAFIGWPVDGNLLAALGKLVQKQVSPMRTTVTHANYRRQVAAVLAQRLLHGLAAGADQTVLLN